MPDITSGAISETVHEFYIRQPVNPERGETRASTLLMDWNNPARCETCGGLLVWRHDHRDDFTGIDDGPYRERKKAAPKPAAEISEIRARAWATRRQKYGQRGHR